MQQQWNMIPLCFLTSHMLHPAIIIVTAGVFPRYAPTLTAVR